jgi:hypothetical protein
MQTYRAFRRVAMVGVCMYAIATCNSALSGAAVYVTTNLIALSAFAQRRVRNETQLF